MQKFFVQFKGSYGTLYLGKGWQPVASKASAAKFPSIERAQERLANIREIMALPANAHLWYAAHIDEARIV